MADSRPRLELTKRSTPGGVALSAIQGLNEKDAAFAELRAEIEVE